MTRVSLDLHHDTTTLEDEIAVVASELGVSEHLVRRLINKLKQGSTRGTPVNRNVNGVNYTTSYRIHDPTFSRGVTHTKGPLAGWRSHTIEADAERGYEALVKQDLDLDDEERTIARELWVAIEAKGGGRSVRGLTRR